MWYLHNHFVSQGSVSLLPYKITFLLYIMRLEHHIILKQGDFLYNFRRRTRMAGGL